MRILQLLAVLALGLVAFPAAAGRLPVPLKDYSNQTFTTSSGDAATLEQIKGAIVRGAAVRGWVVKEASPTELEATIVVREHTVGVTISFDKKAFSVKYRMSDKMDYGVDEEGRTVIHPKYNGWVENLIGDIRKELAKV
jgi:hypothetical protein